MTIPVHRVLLSSQPECWHLLWLKLCLPRRYAEVLTPVPMKVILLGNRVSADVMRWSHTGSEWVLNPKMCVPLWREIWRHRENWSYAGTSQGTPRISGNYQKPEKARKDSSLEPLERVWPSWQLELGLPTSKLWENKFPLFKHPQP